MNRSNRLILGIALLPVGAFVAYAIVWLVLVAASTFACLGPFRLVRGSWVVLPFVLVAVPLTVVTASMAGFAMALVERRSRMALVVLSVALLMVPVTATWLTRFLLFSWVGLTDTLPLGNLDARRDWGYAGDYVRAEEIFREILDASPDAPPIEAIAGIARSRIPRGDLAGAERWIRRGLEIGFDQGEQVPPVRGV